MTIGWNAKKKKDMSTTNLEEQVIWSKLESPKWNNHGRLTWRFQCRGIPRRSGSQGGLGVLGVLRFVALFCGCLPLFCGRFAAILRAFPVSRRLR